MACIKLFRPETYPIEVREIRKNIFLFSDTTKENIIQQEFLRDYASSEMWKSDSDFGKLHAKLMTVLEYHDIVAYHNTRLSDTSKIIDNGLIFSDDRYIESLRNDMLRLNVLPNIIDEIISMVIHERDRWECNGENRRKNEICFIYDWDYYKDYDKFLATYGGEFLEFALASKRRDKGLKKYKEVIKLGKPYVVEFSIPYMQMDHFLKQDIARYMLEEWLHLDLRGDEPSHQYDGRIEFEIPPERILKIYEVEDDFKEIDSWLFET